MSEILFIEKLPSFLLSTITYIFIFILIVLIYRRLAASFPDKDGNIFYSIIKWSMIIVGVLAMIFFSIGYGTNSYKVLFDGKVGDWTFALSFWGGSFLIVILTAIPTILVKRYKRRYGKWYYKNIFSLFAFIFLILFGFSFFNFIVDTYQIKGLKWSLFAILVCSVLPAIWSKIGYAINEYLFKEEHLLKELDLLVFSESGHRKAIDILTRAIKIYPMAEAYEKRAQRYSFLEENDLAIHDYSEAIRQNPTNALLYKYRAELRENCGDIKGATEDMLKFRQFSKLKK